MTRLLFALLICWICIASLPLAFGQDSFAGVDLVYPEFAHPNEDAVVAIQARDFRFITTDRHQTVPGVERYARLKEIYGTKFIQQRLRIFVSRSENFSFNLRARAYASDYNRTLLRYLLRERAKK